MTQEELKVLQDMFTASEQRMSNMMDEKLEAQDKRTDGKLEPLKTQMDIMQGKMDKMQRDIDHITEQVDIAYNWVDRIDLRVKTLERG